MKRLLAVIFLAGIIFLGVLSTSQAAIIDTEAIQTNPSSTENLWEFSYVAPNSVISGSSYYPTSINEYSGAVFQGYLTGVSTVRPTVDHFNSITPASRSTYVFTTYFLSTTNQTVRLSSGGDDGHSIFVDDNFMAGNGYSYTAAIDFDMTANQIYKLSYVGCNYGGGFELWSNIKGNYDSSTNTWGWGGHLFEASQYNILMDASGNFDAVPIPSTISLLGIGLLGIAGVSRKKK